ncbi:hypothetical protein JAO73_12155 [Hymenobacter sp. BT523]|uniref:hypothetical protein n=1 Tax=Hymenobacter sp. BT523 TaxID=2795725 RepID=UPI0018EC2E99|nr:hypothetical protein [Hymenobacter sp. BT523]MBJ6109771.1 hypothetical protein [Hymenobacter sp. BT523]
MALSLPFRFATRGALGLLGAALLAGCCANDVCEADDPLADAVQLRFAKNFSVADLDTVIVLRYPKKFTNTPRPETVTLVRTPAQARDSVLLLNNDAPFSRVGNTNLGAYRYVVQYLAHPNGVNKPVTTTALVIDSIRVQGNYYKTSGCCTNYRNTGKTAYVQGRAYDLTLFPYLEVPK